MELKLCYKYLNKLLNEIKPKNILYVGKIFGEYFLTPDKTPYIVDDNVKITTYIIKEEPLYKQELIEFDNFINIHQIKKYYYITFDEYKTIQNLQEYDFIFVDTVHYYHIIKYIVNYKNYKNGVKIFFHDVCPSKEYASYREKIRTINKCWIGETYLAFYNFYKKNQTNVEIFNDEICTGFGILTFDENLNIIGDNEYDENEVLHDLMNNENFHIKNEI